MADTEKITVNMSVVDLGKIDLLAEEGFYSNRTDFIRAAVRRQLDMHAEEVKSVVIRKEYIVGVLVHTREGLERRLKKGERLSIRVVGMVVLSDDISPELARQTIDSLSVWGVLRANKAITDALKDRIRR